MLHLELLRNFLSKDLTIFGYKKSLFGFFSPEMRDNFFTVPYLSNQLLAFTALHSSVINPIRKPEFHSHSIQLRGYALALFREESNVGVKNFLPVFLFTSIHALHVFAERMIFRQDDFANFLSDFLDILHLHQKVREVTNRTWSLLLKSPLKPLLDSEASAFMHESSQDGCSQLIELINSASIDSSAKIIYLQAIRCLRMTTDGSQQNYTEESRIGSVIAWLVMIPSGFINLLAERRPEALIVLAHFGALLHLYRGFWVFGDSGKYVIDSVSSYLGCAWDDWLRWPKRISQKV
ncbi:hypothetical protein N7528_000843 [Penicillium herquei]|nr:hypothetical protein N7528_000843 [Penicillium herquei]